MATFASKYREQFGRLEPWFDPDADFDENVRRCSDWRKRNGYYDYRACNFAREGRSGSFVPGELFEVPDGCEVRVVRGAKELHDIPHRREVSAADASPPASS